MAMLDEEWYYIAAFLFGAIVIANFVLLLVFKENYRILSFWISGYSIVACAISTIVAFDDMEPALGGVSLCEGLLVIATFITAAVIA